MLASHPYNARRYCTETKLDCAAVLVGNGNTFEPRSHVEPSVAVTENCVIGASCRLSGREELPSGTVICGSTHTRYNRANSKSIQVNWYDHPIKQPFLTV